MLKIMWNVKNNEVIQLITNLIKDKGIDMLMPNFSYQIRRTTYYINMHLIKSPNGLIYYIAIYKPDKRTKEYAEFPFIYGFAHSF